LKLPTAEEEAAYPEAADSAYQSVTTWLLTQTRDTKRFSILFRENISFGFRRNLWGLKPIGAAVTLMASCASTAAIAYCYWAEQKMPTPEVAIVTAAAWLLLLVWIAVITRSWVRIPQLLAACDTLGAPQSAQPRARRAAKK
jgi:hypothetical protein